MHALLLVVALSSAPAQYAPRDCDDDDFEVGERIMYESRRRGIRLTLQVGPERTRQYYDAPPRRMPRYEVAPPCRPPYGRAAYSYGSGCDGGRAGAGPSSYGYGNGYGNGYRQPAPSYYAAPRCPPGGPCPPPGVRESIGR